MTSHLVNALHTQLPPGARCIHQQRTPAARYQFCLQFLIHSTFVLVLWFRKCRFKDAGEMLLGKNTTQAKLWPFLRYTRDNRDKR